MLLASSFFSHRRSGMVSSEREIVERERQRKRVVREYDGEIVWSEKRASDRESGLFYTLSVESPTLLS